MKKRTLSLNRESLTELSIEDLGAVVGAEAPDLPTEGGVEGLGYCLTFRGSRCIY
ncbi:MAG TPA: hypothetical protein VNQ77_00700 [Frankiaceae bacterium]|nr:hypothetical protein [Frankiaceae bacterium]